MDTNMRVAAERSEDKGHMIRLCLLLFLGLFTFSDWNLAPIWSALLAIAMWRELACLKTENRGFAMAHVGAALYAVLLSLTALADATPVRVFLAAKMPLLTPVLTTAAIGLMFVGLYRGINQARQAAGMTAGSHVAIGLALVRPVILLLAVGGFTLVLWPLIVLAIYTLCLILLCRDTPAGLGGKGKSYFFPALSWAAVLVLSIYLAAPHFSRLPVEAKPYVQTEADPALRTELTEVGIDETILDRLDGDEMARLEGTYAMTYHSCVYDGEVLAAYVEDGEDCRIVYIGTSRPDDPCLTGYVNAVSVIPKEFGTHMTLTSAPHGRVTWRDENGDMFEQELTFISGKDIPFEKNNTDREQFFAQYSLPKGNVSNVTITYFWEVTLIEPDTEQLYRFDVFTAGRYEKPSYPYISPVEVICQGYSQHGWTVTSGPYEGSFVPKDSLS